MKTQKNHRRNIKRSKKNKIKKQNATRKRNNKRGGGPTRSERHENMRKQREIALLKEAAKREIKNAKAREKKAQKAIADAAATFVAETTAAETAIGEIIPVIIEEATSEALRISPTANPIQVQDDVIDLTGDIEESAKDEALKVIDDKAKKAEADAAAKKVQDDAAAKKNLDDAAAKKVKDDKAKADQKIIDDKAKDKKAEADAAAKKVQDAAAKKILDDAATKKVKDDKAKADQKIIDDKAKDDKAKADQKIIDDKAKDDKEKQADKDKAAADAIRQQQLIVYDNVDSKTRTPIDFFEDYKDSNPFIIISSAPDNKVFYSGNAIGWSKGKEFVDCFGERRFIKVYLNDKEILILKPTWYDSKVIPGNKFFILVLSKRVLKYRDAREAYGANNCNQKDSENTYILVEELPLKTNTNPAAGLAAAGPGDGAAAKPAAGLAATGLAATGPGDGAAAKPADGDAAGPANEPLAVNNEPLAGPADSPDRVNPKPASLRNNDFSSMSYQPNSYDLFASPSYKKYFSSMSYQPNSYDLFNSTRTLSGGNVVLANSDTSTSCHSSPKSSKTRRTSPRKSRPTASKSTRKSRPRRK